MGADIISNEVLALFASWWEEAQRLGAKGVVKEPTAVALATANGHANPHVRIVLLKAFDARGFVFYTNYESAKGRQLAARPRGALCFFWDALAKQIRAEGAITPVSPAESDQYFATRDRDSQIGAWASDQSQVMRDESELRERFRAASARFAGQAEVPRPPHWGGYRLVPERVEFWQGKPSRLHERFQFVHDKATGAWRKEWLCP